MPCLWVQKSGSLHAVRLYTSTSSLVGNSTSKAHYFAVRHGSATYYAQSVISSDSTYITYLETKCGLQKVFAYQSSAGTHYVYASNGTDRASSAVATLTAAGSYTYAASNFPYGGYIDVYGAKGGGSYGGYGEVKRIVFPANSAISVTFSKATTAGSGSAGSNATATGYYCTSAGGLYGGYKCATKTYSTSLYSAGSGGSNASVSYSGARSGSVTAYGGGGGGGICVSTTYYKKCTNGYEGASGASASRCSLSSSRTLSGTSGTGGKSGRGTASSSYSGATDWDSATDYTYNASTAAKVVIGKFTE